MANVGVPSWSNRLSANARFLSFSTSIFSSIVPVATSFRDEDGFVLADAMDAVDRLFLDGRIPPRIIEDHRVGRCEVQPRPPALRLTRNTGTAPS